MGIPGISDDKKTKKAGTKKAPNSMLSDRGPSSKQETLLHVHEHVALSLCFVIVRSSVCSPISKLRGSLTVGANFKKQHDSIIILLVISQDKGDEVSTRRKGSA